MNQISSITTAKFWDKESKCENTNHASNIFTLYFFIIALALIIFFIEKRIDRIENHLNNFYIDKQGRLYELDFKEDTK